MPYLLLALAIISEVCATTCLKLTDGFTRLLPSFGVAAAYALSFALLGRALKDIPVSFAYAVWSGAGTAAVAAIGAVAFGESLGRPQWLGIALIILGVVVLNLHRAP
ncbi:small multidrug resistance pump [Streptomyces sp. DvalAA-14]|uniref:DMT family transporter n=1 Tax=unclassified Streptomyces TaxID=2593676 RepID=UPI00081B06DE|nr:MULTISPECIES: multidrug efflux SMR transporter [unclassified Streptomyces]MYS21112.1 QacE family quaternary ammonium compound efflux SMR transporter [Streptomyces sp. SID4948]SCD84286.1 small multidrug resistance pump [Streptomyces sp. DvalAA-14]